MFDDNNKNQNTNPPDLNAGKEFPFKKIEQTGSIPVEEKKLAGNKAPIEDILSNTEIDKEPARNASPARKAALNAAGGHSDAGGPIKELEQEKVQENDDNDEMTLKEPLEVPSMQHKPHLPTSAPLVSPEIKKSVPNTQEKPSITTPPITPQQPVKPQKNKIFMIMMIVLIVVVLGLAGIFAYNYFTKDSTPEETSPNESLDELLDLMNKEKQDVGEDVDDSEQDPGDIEDETENEEDTPYLDSDNDGLSNEEEFNSGTNAYKADTDEDGLNDFEEIEIYNSDPVNSDTDGDGYKDGDEVKNGYDPLRAGDFKL